MIKIENIVTPSSKQWKSAIMGARNAYNSWDRSDSAFYCWDKYGEFCNDEYSYYGGPHVCKLNSEDEFLQLGPNDLKLLRNLAKAGDDHGKFARMLPVYMDITAPIFLWSELDTYKVGTVRNSCSFMHKGTSKPFELTDFSVESGAESEFLKIIVTLNFLREEYLKTKNDKLFLIIRELLPQGYNQKATWQANYQVLWNIYKRRKTHRLPDWHTFCDAIETLPYFKEIYLEGQV